MTGSAALELALAGIVIFALDQASKALAVRALASGRSIPAWPRSPVRLHLVANRQPGLGLIRSRRALVLIWALLVTGTTLLAHTSVCDQLPTRLGLGAALGGATGNLADRLRHGMVMDFVDLRVWPVFNVADVGIVGGSALALWSLLAAPPVERLAALVFARL